MNLKLTGTPHPKCFTLAGLFSTLLLIAPGCAGEDPVPDAGTETFVIGGEVSGLLGTVTLTNGIDSVAIAENGVWAFPTALEEGAPFVVLVSSQPRFSTESGSVEQICTVSNASGKAGPDLPPVNVHCSTEAFVVSGRVHGLEAGATLTLRNNGGDEVTIEGTEVSSLDFTFPAKVASGAPFEVTVTPVVPAPAGNTQGSDVEQRCEVGGGSGVVSRQDVVSVDVRCEAVLHSVRVNVAGLVAGATVTVQNRRTATEATPAPPDNVETLVLNESGVFAFVSAVASGQSYEVSIGPGSNELRCEVTGTTSGVIGTEDVEVAVSCKECGTGAPCLVFTTSETHTGNLGGLSGADAICQRLAEEATLPGTYKAWLSDSMASPDTRFVHSTGPYRLVDGSLVAENWTSLTTTGIRVPLDVDQTGAFITSDKEAWTNTNLDGTASSTTASTVCSDWSSDENGVSGRVGETTRKGTEGWTSSHSDPCNAQWRLYCFQQTAGAGTPPPTP